LRHFQLWALECLREIYLYPSLICAWQAVQLDTPDFSLLHPASCWHLLDWLRNLQSSPLYSSCHCSALVALNLHLGNFDCCMAFGNCFLGLPMIGWGGFSNFDCRCWNKVPADPCTLLPPPA